MSFCDIFGCRDLWGGEEFIPFLPQTRNFKGRQKISLDLMVVFLGFPPVVAEAFEAARRGASLFSKPFWLLDFDGTTSVVSPLVSLCRAFFD
jgi:hypothetical protein